MKKIILLLLLVLVSVTASARKSYITVFFPSNHGTPTNNYFILTGDVPDNIDGLGYSANAHSWYNSTSNNPYYSLGEILNVLSEYGYEVEFVNNDNMYLLLSKEIPSGSQTEIVGDLNSDSEVNVADVNKLVNIILGIIKKNPSILEQIKD